MKLLIVDNYDSFTYNLVQLAERAGADDFIIVKNDNLKSLPTNDFDKILISPGPGIASEAGQLMWFLKQQYKTKSILGICLGHEAIAELFGAKLSKLYEPMHGIKNMAKIVIHDRIFNGLPESFSIGHYHSWNIKESTLPAELEVILRDENNLNMAIRHVKYDLTGLQFHPESIMTDFGLKMVGNWLLD